MAFIIPDKTLEKLVCDSCNKYLSVRPVKIYRNGDTKCGRCAATETTDNGVLSLIGHIGDYCLFKCINRFDGCRELLSYSQVLTHEKTCVGRVYQCPVCQDWDEFTSFQLERHFRIEHERNILAYPRFIVNLNALLEPSMVFFYIQDDSLFFISFRYNHSGGEIRISIRLIGTPEQAQKITRQCWITSPDNQTVEFVSKKMNCTNTEVESSWFCIEELDVVDTKFILVHFELKFNEPQCLQISNAIAANGDLDESIVSGPELERHDSLTPTLGAVANPKDSAGESYVPFTPMVAPAEPRKIHLTSDFLQTYPDVRTSPCCTAIIHFDRLVYLQCKNCNDICWTGIDENMDQFYICERDQHSLCYCCFKYLLSQMKVKEVDYISTTLSWELLRRVMFTCKWGCEETFTVTSIFDHEDCECGLGKYWSCGLCNFQGRTEYMYHESNMSGACLVTPFKQFCYNYNVTNVPYIPIIFDTKPSQDVFLKNNKLSALISRSNKDKFKNIAFVELNTNKIAFLFDRYGHYLAQFRHSITFKCEEDGVFLKVVILE